jgi:molybdopterin converting factor small subunit
MITVKLLFFGATAEWAGTRRAVLHVMPDRKASELFAEIVERHPQMRQHKLLFAINREYVSGDEIVSDGDELAVFTAVSGG